MRHLVRGVMAASTAAVVAEIHRGVVLPGGDRFFRLFFLVRFLARLGCRTMQRTFADRGSGLAFGCLFRGRLCLGFGLGLGFGLRFCRGGFLLGLGSGFGFFLLLSALLLFNKS